MNMITISLFSAALVCVGLSRQIRSVSAQIIITNPANPDQTPRYLQSSINYLQTNQRYTLPRFLQTSGGNVPDLIPDDNSCETAGGLKFVCRLYQRVGNPTDYMDLNITILCVLGTAQFDFRRASDCSCSTLVTPSDPTRITKTCPCSVCPMNFGSSSVSIDCTNYVVPTDATDMPSMMPSLAPTLTTGSTNSDAGSYVPSIMPTSSAANDTALTRFLANSNSTGAVVDGNGTVANTKSNSTTGKDDTTGDIGNSTMAPTDISNVTNSTEDYDPFLFGTCVSIDCAASCNGTCSIGCDSGAGPTCSFCANSDTAPTAAPTGSGKADITKLTSQAATTITTGLTAIILSAAILWI